MKLRRTLTRFLCYIFPLGIIATVLTLHNVSHSQRRHNNTNTYRRRDTSTNSIAIAIKTGKEVAFDRVPIQLVTFLRAFPHFILVSNSEFTVGFNLTVHNVVASYSLNSLDSISTLNTTKLDIDRDVLKRAKQPSIQNPEGSVIPNVESEGWKLDAFKNLPGLKKLFELYPKMDWFMMIDDDTFVFADNLMENLKELNPQTPIYMGRAGKFVGCDGVSKHGDGPLFAHGGSGYILSKAAMLLLISNFDRCNQKYSTCWAGDVRVALCMRDLGIKVQHNYGFNGVPPDAFSPLWPKNMCAKPITFHHLLPSAMQRLYTLETQTENLTFAALFQAERAWGNATKWEVDVKRNGGDYKTMVRVRADQCQDACWRDEECRSYTWGPAADEDDNPSGDMEVGQCWMKKSMNPGQYSVGWISGVYPERFVCN